MEDLEDLATQRKNRLKDSETAMTALHLEMIRVCRVEWEELLTIWHPLIMHIIAWRSWSGCSVIGDKISNERRLLQGIIIYNRDPLYRVFTLPIAHSPASLSS